MNKTQLYIQEQQHQMALVPNRKFKVGDGLHS